MSFQILSLRPLRLCAFVMFVACDGPPVDPGTPGAGPCDDGVFCNGTERLTADGACVAGFDPCDDGSACTTDTCDESTGLCSHALGDGCDACFSDCEPDCTGRVCGDDGCGGSCGDCAPGEACAPVAGTCEAGGGPGTCGDPIVLTPIVDGQETIAGDSTDAVHQLVPSCNSTSTAVEVVYVFTVDEPVGLDARSIGYDTVLHLRDECANENAAATLACSDDASPPGDYGSRLAVQLDPGTYYLIVDGYDASQYGPYALSVRFVSGGCVPACDGLYCGGDDGCGGTCGDCDPGYTCDADYTCQPDSCTPDCTGKECGDDGCGGSCGTCEGAELCVQATSTCEGFPTCDHAAPSCDPACAGDEFCGSDCACHGTSDPLPDLVVDAARLADEILFETAEFTEASCAVAEACVGGVGSRELLRFSVAVVNQGQGTLEIGPPDTRPDLFEYSACHGHNHVSGFATYELLDGDGAVVLVGRKQAYCVEDTAPFHQGPNVSCDGVHTCDDQGIQAGWSDLYGNALDCQWLDVTDVPAGDYQLRVSLNPEHRIEEVSFANNGATVPVAIP